MRNKSHSRKRLIEDAQQNSVKHVARRSDPGLFDFKSHCFYFERPCIEVKKHSARKNFEIASIMNTKNCTSSIEICRNREDNGDKNIGSRLLGISSFVIEETR